MEFNVSSAELLKGLSDVARAIPAKSPISILENFLFTVKDGNLEITASDQELTLRTNISVDAREDGSMAVPAHQMMDLIKALPDQPISFKTTSDSSFECPWANGNSSLPFFPAEDYPEIKLRRVRHGLYGSPRHHKRERRLEIPPAHRGYRIFRRQHH